MMVYIYSAQLRGAAALMVDNIGFCYAAQNGSSRDEKIWTVAKFIDDIAEGLGIRVKVFHTSRRSELGEKLADHLSKGEMLQVEQEWPGRVDVGQRASKRH